MVVFAAAVASVSACRNLAILGSLFF